MLGGCDVTLWPSARRVRRGCLHLQRLPIVFLAAGLSVAVSFFLHEKFLRLRRTVFGGCRASRCGAAKNQGTPVQVGCMEHCTRTTSVGWRTEKHRRRETRCTPRPTAQRKSIARIMVEVSLSHSHDLGEWELFCRHAANDFTATRRTSAARLGNSMLT